MRTAPVVSRTSALAQDVRTNGCIRYLLFNGKHTASKCIPGIGPVHSFKNVVIAALQGDVKVAAKPIRISYYLNDIVSKLKRLYRA